ncbi:NosD domain-containing protein [Thermococcus barossii]|nr:NosD domain-containing protein [Thermococcus barossii]
MDSNTEGCSILETLIISSYGGIYLAQKGAGHVISRNRFENVSVPVMAYGNLQAEISFNEILRPERGIYLSSTVKSTIINNTIVEPLYSGIFLKGSSDANIIAGNRIEESAEDGITIQSSEGNVIENNTLTLNERGVSVFGNENTIRSNVIANNSLGIYSADTRGNLFYNNYLSNEQNAIDVGNNHWNTTKKPGKNIIGGPYIGGNYWSDYDGKDTNGDWIGDTQLPHTSGGNVRNGDWLPLVLPAPEKRADLLITDIWKKGNEIGFQVMNAKEKFSEEFTVTLLINGEAVESTVLKGLGSGERIDGSFELSECPWKAFQVEIIADEGDSIPEFNESNNFRVETFKCDEKPPKILNVTVEDVGTEHVELSILTDEPSRVEVKYGRDALSFEGTFKTEEFSREHSIRIGSLKPSTLYRFVITAIDESGNVMRDRERFFETEKVADGKKPMLGELSIRGSGDYYEIRIPVRDESGISRVEFYVDGMLVGTVYNPQDSASVAFSPSALGMSGPGLYRDHEITVRVCDMTGVCGIGSELWRPEYEVHSVDVEIISPQDRYSVKAGRNGVAPGTLVEVEIYAAEYELRMRDCPSSELGELACMHNPGEIVPHAIGMVTLHIWGPQNYHISRTFRPRSDDELTYTYTWDMSGLPVGLYLITAIANSTDGGFHYSRAITVEVQPREEDYSLETRIVRRGNYLNVTLRVLNTGDVPFGLMEITQRLIGFQAVERDGESYNMKTVFDPATGVNTIYFTFDSVVLQPGEHFEVSYPAVPVMYPHPIYVSAAYGGITVETYSTVKRFYQGYGVMTLDGGTWKREDISEAWERAIKESDYLIVTDPTNLYTLNDDESVNNLLSAIAELAVYRNGVIGYVDSFSSIRMRVGNPELVSGGDTDGDGTKEVVTYSSSSGLWIHEPVQRFRHAFEGIGSAKAMSLVDFDGDGKDEVVLVFDNMTVMIYGREVVTDGRGNPREEYIKEFEFRVPHFIGGRLACGFLHMDVLEQSRYPSCLYQAQDRLVWFRYSETDTTPEWRSISLDVPKDSLIFIGNSHPENSDEVIILRPDGTLEFYDLMGVQNANLLRSVQTSYRKGDDVDWGDVDGDGVGELLVFKKELGTVEVYDTAGLRETRRFFYSGKAMLVDIVGGQSDEIAVVHGENFEFTTWREVAEGPSPLSTTLIERWGTRMKEGWLSDGYLLIVGETEVVPAQKMSFEPLWLDWGAVKHVRVTDLPYANTEGDVLDPELIIGRIVGDTADKLEVAIRNAIKAARGECSFDRSHALILSGWPKCRSGGCSDNDFAERSRAVKRALEGQGTLVTIVFTTDYRDVKEGDRIVVNGKRLAVEAFFNNTPEKDIIHLEGHGNTNVIDDISVTDVINRRNPFGSACPFAYAESCLTGDYTKGVSVAEAFLQAGAVVYLGSTEETYSAPWTARAKRLYRRWELGTPIGDAFKELKRDMGIGRVWEIEDDTDLLWVMSMHLYGDPKFGLGAGTPEGENEGAPESLELETPAYSIQETGEGSLVELEEGGILLLPGRSPIPYYTYSVKIPRGRRVQNVELVEREAKEVLSITMVPFRVGKLGEEVGSGTEEATPLPPYQWRVSENPDGSSTLFIRVFPLEYNNLTKRAVLYGRHRFTIEYIETGVEIAGARLERDVYKPGERVRVAGVITNSEGSTDVILSAVLRKGTYGATVSEAKLLSLGNLTGTGYFSFEFQTKGLTGGQYGIEILARDVNGNVLDRKLLHFLLGVKRVENILTIPQEPSPGAAFTAVLRVINTGDLPVTGEVHLSSGTKEVIMNVTLEPGEETTFEETFRAGKSGAEVTGYVLYDGTMSEPATASFSFSTSPKADFHYSPETPEVGMEIQFKDTSLDPDGEIVSWEWDFGDGYVSRERNPTHCYRSEGTYTVRLKVTDSTGLTSETTKKITVTAEKEEEGPPAESPTGETEPVSPTSPGGQEGGICGMGLLLLLLLVPLAARGKR